MEARALIHLSQGNGVQKIIIPLKNDKNVMTTSNDILIQQELEIFFHSGERYNLCI